MASAGTNQKVTGWRPKVSVRVLLVLWALACAYLACWQPTRTRGPSDVVEFVDPEPGAGITYIRNNATASFPLIVGVDESFVVGDFPGSTPVRAYYLWCFGYVVPLPYKREIKTVTPLADLDLPFSLDDFGLDQPAR